MVSTVQTRDDFLDTLRKSDLLSPEQMEVCEREWPRFATPQQGAHWLIESRWITAFQADHLFQGKTRGYYLGNYRILRPLGGGATGAVFLCEHRLMKHQVAIKVLAGELVKKDAKNLQRFRREARAAASLQHPNIVQTVDLDEDEGRHFLVMEYVEGVTLDKLLEHKKKLAVADVVKYAIDALDGLQHITDAGLVHRDIKPGNLLIDKTGVVKILDLGLARFTDDRHDDLTVQQGVGILGTVDFMSPEQAMAGGAVDHRADIYSLGATLYFLLTGKYPLPDGSVTAKIIAAQFHTPTRIGELRDDVDPKLDEIIGKMMTKDPARRYQNAKEAAEDLRRWHESRCRKAASPATMAMTAVPATTTSHAPAPTLTPSPARRPVIPTMAVRTPTAPAVRAPTSPASTAGTSAVADPLTQPRQIAVLAEEVEETPRPQREPSNHQRGIVREVVLAIFLGIILLAVAIYMR